MIGWVMVTLASVFIAACAAENAAKGANVKAVFTFINVSTFCALVCVVVSMLA